MEALVVLFHIVKHRLHVCLELVAGQRGVGELWVLVRDLSELVLQCAEQLAGFGPRLRGVVASINVVLSTAARQQQHGQHQLMSTLPPGPVTTTAGQTS